MAVSTTADGHGYVQNVAAEDKNVDQFEIGVSMGLGENGKIAFAHKSHDTIERRKNKFKLGLRGQYTIGSMTAYLGFGQAEDRRHFTVGMEGERPPETGDSALNN